MVKKASPERRLAGAATLAAVVALGLTPPAGAQGRLRIFGLDARQIPVNAALTIADIDGQPSHGDRAVVSVGQHVTLRFRVRFRSRAIVDVTQDANSTFATTPASDTFGPK